MWFIVLLFLIVGIDSTHKPAPPPPPAPVQRVYPSYCPTRPFGQVQTYYPCMYSSLEKSA